MKVILHYQEWTRSTWVSKTPRSGTFRNAVVGFEGDKSISWRHKKSSARFDRVAGAWQLARACQVGSIVHTSESNSNSGTFLQKFAVKSAVNHWVTPRNFFCRKRFDSRDKCRILVANCLADSTGCGGSSRSHGLSSLATVQVAQR